MYELTIETHFSSAHRLRQYNGECERLHGHNYVVKVAIDYQLLDSDFLIDFREVNSYIQSAIEKLDHKILLPGKSDIIIIKPLMNNANWLVQVQGKEYLFPKKDVVILEKINQTTSENLAIFFHEEISEKLKKFSPQFTTLSLTVTIGETAGNEASYSNKIAK